MRFALFLSKNHVVSGNVMSDFLLTCGQLPHNIQAVLISILRSSKKLCWVDQKKEIENKSTKVEVKWKLSAK